MWHKVTVRILQPLFRLWNGLVVKRELAQWPEALSEATHTHRHTDTETHGHAQ